MVDRSQISVKKILKTAECSDFELVKVKCCYIPANRPITHPMDKILFMDIHPIVSPCWLPA